MSDKVKVLLVGDETDAPWHPLAPARLALPVILGDSMLLESTDDYHRFSGLQQQEYGLCISYTDCWDRSLTPEQTAGLLAYVAGGGGLLVIHNGISIQRRYEVRQMMGARFTGHPAYQLLTYHPSEEAHPIMEGIGSFSLEEEPYQFEFDPFTEKTILMEYEFEEKRWPAAWAQNYGLGRVVYLSPGHHAPSFQQPVYRNIIERGARWAAKLL